MDTVNRTLTQLRDLFLSLTPGGRITAGLLLAVLVVSLGYLFHGYQYGSDAYLLGGEVFPITQRSAMQGAFAEEGLTGWEFDGSGRVRIPRGKEADFIAAMAQHNALPAQFGDALREAIKGSSPWTGRFQQETQMKVAIQLEVVRFIRKFPNVSDATVLYDQKERGGLHREEVSSASVVVEMLGSNELGPRNAHSIRHLVAAGVNMKPEDVKIGDTNGRIYMASSNGSFSGDAGNERDIARMREYQEVYRKEAIAALHLVPGAVVTTYVELEPTVSRHERAVTYGDKTVVATIATTREIRDTTSSDPGGRPGFESQSNQPIERLAEGGGKESTQSEEKTDETLQNALPGTEALTDHQGLAVKMVKVGVSVPASYFREIWETLNPTPEGEEPKTPTADELDKIQADETATIKEMVATVIPPPTDGSDKLDLVTVSVFQDIPSKPMPEASLAEQATGWLAESWRMLGILGLVAFSLLWLRSTVRSVVVPVATSESGEQTEKQQGTEASSEGAEETASTKRGFAGDGGSSLADELAELVESDPDAAANVLRNWIGMPA